MQYLKKKTGQKKNLSKCNENEDIINSVAIQDHYSRIIFQKNKNFFPTIIQHQPILDNSKKQIIMNNPLNKLYNPENPIMKKYKNIRNHSKKSSLIEDFLKCQKYNKKLSLAQRIGLVPAPPKPLISEDWALIEDLSTKRKDGICAICLVNFGIKNQVILSCSHVFHENCLKSFERHSKNKFCPICRKKDYERKNHIKGVHEYKNKCVLDIQRVFKGFLKRKEFAIRMKGVIINNSLLRRRILNYRLGLLTKGINKAMKNKEVTINKYLDNIQKEICNKKNELGQNLEELHLKKQENMFLRNELKNIERNEGKKEISAQEKVKWENIKNIALERQKQSGDCAICCNKLFSENKPTKDLYLLSCSHIYHKNCLHSFERYNFNLEIVCPICRANYEKMEIISLF